MIEYLRRVSVVILTEEGIFHDGEIPGDYTGPQIPVELCHAITYTDINGNLSTQTFANPQAMDSSRTLQYYRMDATEVVEAEVSEEAQVGDYYRHRLPQAVKDRADAMRQLLEDDGSTVI